MAVWVTVNQPPKRWRSRYVQCCFYIYADYNCNSDKFLAELSIISWLARDAAWTLTRYAIKADGQTSFLRLMSKDFRSKVSKISEFVWFRILAKKPKAGGAVERNTLAWRVRTIR